MIIARVTKANGGRLEKLGSEAAGRDGEGLVIGVLLYYGGGRRIVKRMLRYGFVFYVIYYRIVYCILYSEAKVPTYAPTNLCNSSVFIQIYKSSLRRYVKVVY